MKPGHRWWTEQEVGQLHLMVGKGLEVDQICEALDRTERSIHAKMRDQGLLLFRAHSGAQEVAKTRHLIPPRAVHPNLTAAIMGDPLPGRSALDQRGAR